MNNLNKFGMLCVVMALFVAGCGKKKSSADQGNKKLAQSGIPTFQEETETFLNDGSDRDLDSGIENFAFVDDEVSEMINKETADSIVAASDIEFDQELALSSEDNALGYSFKAIHFDFNKNSIRSDQEDVVTQDIQIAQQAVEQGKQVVVEGHSCQIGSAAYNLALSQRRAEAVKKEMVDAGIAPEQVKTIGYGYEKPLVWSDESNRSKLLKDLAPNRRAEILVN
jgi:outer membrane protein OmpA-like peptidoglycan-associated protein